MKFIGIIGLFLVLAMAAGLGYSHLSSDMSSRKTVVSNDETTQGNLYTEALDSAKSAAEQLSGTGAMVEVYAGISVPENSTNVDLSGRALSGSLKAEVRHLEDLTVLNLSVNNFTGLPAEVGQLSNLKVLNLANNPFTGLPHELANLKNLKVLDLRGTEYAAADLVVIKQGLPGTVQILVD